MSYFFKKMFWDSCILDFLYKKRGIEINRKVPSRWAQDAYGSLENENIAV